MRKIAISDIHGCAKTLKALLNALELRKEDLLFFLGDYIDRGPDSRGVLDLIFQLIDTGFQVRCLAGNHDVHLLTARVDSYFHEFWKQRWGGSKTLESFGVTHARDIPAVYVDFLAELPWVWEVGDFILVHAGLDFSAEDPLKTNLEMLEIRNWYSRIDYEWLGSRYVVHGHTPTPAAVIREMVKHFDVLRALDIDAGCFAIQYEGYGNLCAFELESRRLWFQPNIDMGRPWS